MRKPGGWSCINSGRQPLSTGFCILLAYAAAIYIQQQRKKENAFSHEIELMDGAHTDAWLLGEWSQERGAAAGLLIYGAVG